MGGGGGGEEYLNNVLNCLGDTKYSFRNHCLVQLSILNIMPNEVRLEM